MTLEYKYSNQHTILYFMTYVNWNHLIISLQVDLANSH